MVDILSSPSNQSEQALKISGPIFISAVKSLNSYCVWFPTKPRQGLCWLWGLSPAVGTHWGHPHSRESCSSHPCCQRENSNKCKAQTGRSVPCAGDIGNGRGASFSLCLTSCSSLPFPCCWLQSPLRVGSCPSPSLGPPRFGSRFCH